MPRTKKSSAKVEGTTTAADTEAQPLLDRVKARVATDLRNALVDPAQNPEGDFDIVVGKSAASAMDRVQTFNGLIMGVRLAATAISLLLVSAHIDADTNGLRVWTGLVVAYAVFRAVKPIRYSNDFHSLLRVIAEVSFHAVTVVSTGGWDSPLIFTLLTAITVAGLARGFGFSLRVAIATSITVTVPYFNQMGNDPQTIVRSASWSGIIILVALVAGYTRRISGQADRERELAMDRLGRLADANALLFSLHRVTQTLPASLDLGDVLDSTMSRMKSLVSYDSAAILLFDEVDGHWEVMRHQGMHVRSRLGATELPEGLRRAIAQNGLAHIPNLSQISDNGLSNRAGSGIYAVLAARGSIIGLLAIERGDTDQFTGRDMELVEGFVAPAALALDNARWFARLRTVGADEERTRIARDLHDRIGQSLAYLAFELDRMVDRDEAGESLSEPIAQLRDDVRGVIREVRDTLYDLRTDVSEEHGISEILDQYATRVAERSNLTIQVEADKSHRIPLLQEREMWRVAQEALANVEKHAGASAVRVVWRCDGDRAFIDITDNGVGFEQGRAGRMDSYGVLGMRERASSIGAVLEIVSAPGRGTRVRCSLAPSETQPKQVDSAETDQAEPVLSSTGDRR